MTTAFRPENGTTNEVSRYLTSFHQGSPCFPSKKATRNQKPVYHVARMCESQLKTLSTSLRGLNDVCKATDWDNSTEDMAEFWETGLNNWAFVYFLCEQIDILPTSAIDHLPFMCKVSSLLRALSRSIHEEDKSLKPRQHRKLFVLYNTPLVVVSLQSGLNMIGIVRHWLLQTIKQRKERYQEEFSKKESRIPIIICLYDVGGIGRDS
jgi:hypothetical protein